MQNIIFERLKEDIMVTKAKEKRKEQKEKTKTMAIKNVWVVARHG